MKRIMKQALILSTLFATSIMESQKPHENIIEKYKSGTLSAQDIKNYTEYRVIKRFKRRLKEKNKQPYIDYFGIKETNNQTIIATRSIPNDEYICDLEVNYQHMQTYTTILQEILHDNGFAIEYSESFLESSDTVEIEVEKESLDGWAHQDYVINTLTKKETEESLSKKVQEYLKLFFPKSANKQSAFWENANIVTLFMLERIIKKNIIPAVEHIKKTYADLTTNTIAKLIPNIHYETARENEEFARNKDCNGYQTENSIYLKNELEEKRIDVVQLLLTIEHEITHYEQFLNKKAQQKITPGFATISEIEMPTESACEMDAEIESIINFPALKLLVKEMQKLIGCSNSMGCPYFSAAIIYDLAQNILGKKTFTNDFITEHIIQDTNDYEMWREEQKKKKSYKKEHEYHMFHVIPQIEFNKEAFDRIITKIL